MFRLKARHPLVALLAAGPCFLAGSAVGAQTPTVMLGVSPEDSLVDASVRIQARGLRSGQLVSLRATTTALNGRSWEAWASFRVGASGRLAVERARPIKGTYARRDGMGLFWSMRPADWSGSPAAIPLLVPPVLGRVTFTASQAGREGATTSIRRRLKLEGVTVRAETLTADGFVGRFFSLPPSSPRPAILRLGGSNGGLPGDSTGFLLASHGYPTLGLAYFGAPGLPTALKNIPLEYFERALRWLAQQPGVDASKLVVMGTSRGGEAALLLGATYPELIQGVVAYVPSSVVYPSPTDSFTPAWTLGGKPVPYSREFGDPAPDDQPDAIIRVERINGPIFLVGGVLDALWPSARFVYAIVDRLRAHGRPNFTALVYEEAGHAVGLAVPNLAVGTRVTSSRYGPLDLGGDRPADAAARAASWQRLLAFLRRL